MLKASELRKGNLIMDIETGDIVEFVCLDIEVPTGRCYIKYLNGNNNHWDRGWPLVDVNPISLTEGWLEKFGFYEKYKSVHSHWSKGGVGIEQASDQDDDNNTISPAPQEFYYDFNFTISSVHQLQNLYHSLTNEELTINL